jgi:DNA (cytosine-5)-methyltransferase 1
VFGNAGEEVGGRAVNVGSLFSGIGGMDLGLARAGMTVRWQCEIEPYCRRVLAKHWPDVPCYEDVKTIDWTEVEPVDLICGGFPCQPVSLAGKRLAQEDERWLWPEFVRCIRVLRPRYVLVENTTGLLSAGMGDVLGDLAKAGFDAEWGLLSACALGAPHSRSRVFIVAHTKGQRCDGRWCGWPAEKPSESEGCNTREIRPWREEPCPVGVANGIPNRVDRLRGLGNAVVPQVSEWIGRRIMEAAGVTLDV